MSRDSTTFTRRMRVHGVVACIRGFAAIVALCTSATVLAASPGDNALDTRLKHLETELRCLVCQNQTLADSNAPLAEDLRREVRELAVAGRSDDQIRHFLTDRYGDFVLYNPPVKPATWLLWFGPFLLLALGAALWLRIVVVRDRTPADAQRDSQATAHARSLLDT